MHSLLYNTACTFTRTACTFTRTKCVLCYKNVCILFLTYFQSLKISPLQYQNALYAPAGEDVCCSVVFGTHVGVSLLSIM